MKKLLFFLFLLFIDSLPAKNLGVFGESFEIAEKDLLEHIFSRLKVLQETGKLEVEQKKVTERIREMILHPKSLENITETQSRREYKFDPMITVTRDLSDHRGQVFAKKGERFNPLDKINLWKPLLFIDGDDEKQVKWAISKTKDASIQGHEFSKIILVKGSPLDLQASLKDQSHVVQPLYFDQHGVLITKLGIKHVPAIVFQKEGEIILTVIEESIEDEDKQ